MQEIYRLKYKYRNGNTDRKSETMANGDGELCHSFCHGFDKYIGDESLTSVEGVVVIVFNGMV